MQHIADRDFAPVIAAALAAPGFAEDGPDEKITVGFGHNAVLGVADASSTPSRPAPSSTSSWSAAATAPLRPQLLHRTGRSLPKDCMILTLACGKYRFNKLDFGEIGGIPRLLDIGQCNDAYSALQIALALAKAFDCGVNDLPLSLVLSWYEQKAVAILLTLLHLGVKQHPHRAHAARVPLARGAAVAATRSSTSWPSPARSRTCPQCWHR